MAIFDKKKPRNTPRKTRAPQTLDNALEKALIRKAKTDKDWALNAALKKFNLTDSEENPIEAQKKAIKAKVYDRVFTKISNNPELSDRFEEVVMAEIFTQLDMAPNFNDGDGEMPYEPGDEISRTIRSIRSLKQLQHELGGKGDSDDSNGSGVSGFFKSLLDSEFGHALGSALAGKMASGGGAPNTVRVDPNIVVSIDGQLTEVTRAEYKQLIGQGRLKPVAELTQGTIKAEPNPEPNVSNDEPVPHLPVKAVAETPAEIKPIPDFLKGIDFDGLVKYMELEPDEFVTVLKESVEADDDKSKFLWGFFSEATAEGVVNLLTPYRGNAEVDPLLDKLLSEPGVKWLDTVITLVKESYYGESGRSNESDTSIT